MQQHIERLAQNCIEAFDASSRKRALPVEPTDGLDNAKRARLGVEAPPLLRIPPLPEGPISYSQLYTLTEDIGLSSFDVKQLPPDLIVKIAVAVLGRVDPNALSQATEVSSCLMQRTREKIILIILGYPRSISNPNCATSTTSPSSSRRRR
jgi:symplekin